MIGKFIDTLLEEKELPQALTSYSPCFRKEVGAHGIEERGVYRIHQFEKQEMVVVCGPEESRSGLKSSIIIPLNFSAASIFRCVRWNAAPATLRT